MSSLADFSDDERALLVCLPYKVGVFVSYADDESGERDDEREMDRLEECIMAIACLHVSKPFTAEIMRETVEMRDKWPQWAAQSWHVPEEAEKVVNILKSRVSDEELKNYRAALMEIGTAVAEAYGEFGEFDDPDEGGGIFGSILTKITKNLSGLTQDDENHPMNISAAEDSALSQLRSALKP